MYIYNCEIIVVLYHFKLKDTNIRETVPRVFSDYQREKRECIM